MNYNNYSEQQQQRIADEAVERNRFAKSLNASHAAKRKALNERATANFQATQAEQQQAQAQGEQAATEQSLREALKAAYIQANGNEAGFSDAYPRLRAAHVEAQTLANLTPKPATTLDRAKQTLKLLYGG